jgi:hypothetical protein
MSYHYCIMEDLLVSLDQLPSVERTRENSVDGLSFGFE